MESQPLSQEEQHFLAAEQGATVAELRNKVAELMTGVGLGEHFGCVSLRDCVPPIRLI